MPVCPHYPFECIQVSYRGMNKCITNLNNLTTVADIINILLDDLSEKEYLTVNDCCLYIERQPYLFPLKSTDFIRDILLRYSSTNVRFKLAFKRHSSPSRFAQRKKLLRTPIQSSTIINPYEQLRIQELVIQRQQEIITQLTKTNEVSINTRQSRQDEYYKVVNRETIDSSRSLSRVRFRPSLVTKKHEVPSASSVAQVKSILKKSSDQRSSSVDRDIDRLVSLKQEEKSFYTSDDDDLSEQSTTDSCLGSLSSNDSNIQHHLETLV